MTLRVFPGSPAQTLSVRRHMRGRSMRTVARLRRAWPAVRGRPAVVAAALALVGVGGLVVMLVAGDGDRNDPAGAPPTAHAGPPGPPPADGSAPAGDLTGLGAPVETWRRAHTVDGNPFVPGTSYDGNRFGDVWEQDGRIVGFDINYPGGGVSLVAARADVREQLPGDVTLVWSRSLDGCMAQQLRSETLARVLYPRWLPTMGHVQVVYIFNGRVPSLDGRRVVTTAIYPWYMEQTEFRVC